MRELTRVIITAGVCLLAAGCGGTAKEPVAGSAVSSTTSSTTSMASSTTSAAPVAESAIDSLLLSPSEIDAAIGVTGMTPLATSKALATDITVPADAPAEKIACVGIAGTAEAQAYAGSGSTAVRDQMLMTPDGTETATQSVILFGSADQAKAFFAGATQKWQSCHQFSGARSTTTVGPVATENDTLSTIITTKGDRGTDMCERALRVANNVAIEGSACGIKTAGAAVNITANIAAKVAG